MSLFFSFIFLSSSFPFRASYLSLFSHQIICCPLLFPLFPYAFFYYCPYSIDSFKASLGSRVHVHFLANIMYTSNRLLLGIDIGSSKVNIRFHQWLRSALHVSHKYRHAYNQSSGSIEIYFLVLKGKMKRKRTCPTCSVFYMKPLTHFSLFASSFLTKTPRICFLSCP